jgi:hypothetical protein
MTPADLNELARRIENHVPVQPRGNFGTEPVALEIWFSTHLGSPKWTVRFVTGVRGSRRMRAWARGATLEEALAEARRIQEVNR